jgi:putative membrane protein
MRKIFFFVVVMMTPLLTMCSGPYGHMGGWDRGGNYVCGFGYGYGGMFMWILFLIVLGVAIYFIVQSTKSKNVSGQAQETPLDIMKKRYAKGEITKEEFDRMKKELE